MNSESFRIFFISEWAIDDDGCITPYSGSGSCVGIYSCQPLVNFLRNAPRPLSSENMDLLRRYQCGFEQSNIKVCCPSERSEIARLQGTSTSGGEETDPEAPDVSNHRNLRLLPEDCGRLDSDVRIINGNQTGLFEFPWMALLSYRLRKYVDFNSKY